MPPLYDEMNKRKRGAGFRYKAMLGTLGTVALAGGGIAQTDLPMWMRIGGGLFALLALVLSAWIGLPRFKKWLDEIAEQDA